MRLYALSFLIILISVYAYRDWFKSVCALIVLMAVVQHSDFPNSVGGIQGLNPWNMALASVMIAWLLAKRRDGLNWDLPHYINVMLVIYLIVVLVGLVRCLLDPDYQPESLLGDLFSERFVNTIKWPIPGLLLFDGCRSRKRLIGALVCIIMLYSLLAAQVIRWIPASAATDAKSLVGRSMKMLQNEIGYHPINMSMMLAGACWATLACVALAKKPYQRGAIVCLALAIAYAQALTGGRMGYVTWGVVGLTVGLMRWRKYLWLAPAMVVAVSFILPGAVDRMLQGFNQKNTSGETVVDDYEVTSGRTLIWPYVTAKIIESPMFGYGRLAMNRTGLDNRLMRELGESFPHPHNAYLEWLLDNGVVGFLLVMPFYATVIYQSARLFCSKGDYAYNAAGGVCFALTLALLVAAMGSQTFYPREGSVGMWAAIGVMFRMYVARQRVMETQLAQPAPLPMAPVRVN